MLLKNISCVELDDIAVARDTSVFHIRYPLERLSLTAGDSGQMMSFGCSTGVKRNCSKPCGVFDESAD